MPCPTSASCPLTKVSVRRHVWAPDTDRWCLACCLVRKRSVARPARTLVENPRESFLRAPWSGAVYCLSPPTPEKYPEARRGIPDRSLQSFFHLEKNRCVCFAPRQAFAPGRRGREPESAHARRV